MRKEEQMPKINNIVLVHGGFVDGTIWGVSVRPKITGPAQ
jgi:hypothetical protein